MYTVEKISTLIKQKTKATRKSKYTLPVKTYTDVDAKQNKTKQKHILY